MRRANVVSGVVLAAIGLVMLAFVIPAQIDPGPEGIVSPRLVPSMMMIAVTVLGAMLAVASWRAPAGGAPDGPVVARGELAALGRIGAVFAAAVALFLLVSPLAGGIGLIVGTLVALGERRPLVLVLMPAGLLLALWVLFYKVLGTPIA